MGAPGGTSRPPGFTSESLPGTMRPRCTPAVFLSGPGCEQRAEEGGQFHQAAPHASEDGLGPSACLGPPHHLEVLLGLNCEPGSRGRRVPELKRPGPGPVGRGRGSRVGGGGPPCPLESPECSCPSVRGPPLSSHSSTGRGTVNTSGWGGTWHGEHFGVGWDLPPSSRQSELVSPCSAHPGPVTVTVTPPLTHGGQVSCSLGIALPCSRDVWASLSGAVCRAPW